MGVMNATNNDNETNQRAPARATAERQGDAVESAEMKVSDSFQWERDLKVGDKIRVNWGYGLGFRATGLAVIEKINAKSFVVRLTEDVPHGNGIGWEAGKIIRGIPNKMSWFRWNEEHCVEKIDTKGQEAVDEVNARIKTAGMVRKLEQAAQLIEEVRKEARYSAALFLSTAKRDIEMARRKI